MKLTYDTIYLSPHLDDIALSCGGQVYMQSAAGKAILIVTVMAGDPPEQVKSDFIEALHDRWQLQADVVAMRRAEDAEACRILGADHLYWDIPDCIYRSHVQTDELLYSSNDDIFGDIHSSETELIDAISKRVQSLPAHKRLVLPLGVGNHVDHQITRLAAEGHDYGELVYYEEYPYVVLPDALESVTGKENSRWQPTIISLSEAALEAKVKAIAAYESQLSTFFRDRDDMADAVRQYNHSVGGERLWRRIEEC